MKDLQDHVCYIHLFQAGLTTLRGRIPSQGFQSSWILWFSHARSFSPLCFPVSHFSSGFWDRCDIMGCSVVSLALPDFTGLGINMETCLAANQCFINIWHQGLLAAFSLWKTNFPVGNVMPEQHMGHKSCRNLAECLIPSCCFFSNFPYFSKNYAKKKDFWEVMGLGRTQNKLKSFLGWNS